MKKLKRLVACAWWVAALLAGPVAAQEAVDCPPTARAPTPDEIRTFQVTRRDRGFLWRLRKDDRESYLFGTLHLGRLAWTLPGQRVAGALRSADTLALEIDVTDPDVRASLLEALKEPKGRARGSLTPSGGLTRIDRSGGAVNGAPAALPEAPAQWPAALQQRLQRQIAAACVPADALGRLHPVMQAYTLVGLSARRDGLDPGFAQELVLGGYARAAGLRIVSLETPDIQRQALLPDDAADAQSLVEQMLDELERGTARAGLVRLAEAWEAGDLETIERYDEWCDCVVTEADRRRLRHLIDGRNTGLADRIDALHAEGRAVFAAVGALHMTGPYALPQLMQRRGYTVERLVPPPAP